eukprot:GHVH01007869.1.p1 GENE.GHVH01007869.1~~GHVH01007869.1.p1  ORF type:complete len:908 (-),score=106.15 GHVH01007869.1:1006-3504(-)
MAASTGNSKMVVLLLGLGLDPLLKDDSQEAPINKAVYEGHYQVAGHLLKYYDDISDASCHGFNLLHQVCRAQLEFDTDSDFIASLVRRGCGIDSRSESGHTPLMCAVDRWTARPNLVEYLLDSGADVHAVDHSGKTALHFASHPHSVESLLARGAKIYTKDKSGNSPLMHMCSHDKPDAVRSLLRHGAKPDARGNKLWTPFLTASALGRTNVIKVLSEEGADVNLAVRGIGNALSFAALMNQADCIPVLVACGTTVTGDVIEKISAKGDANTVAALVKAVGVSSVGRSILRSVVAHRRTEILPVLLSLGFDLLDPAFPHGTVLNEAVSLGHPEMVETVLIHLHPPDHRGTDGFTPLYHAINNGHYQIADLLLSHGADMHIANGEVLDAVLLKSGTPREEALKFLASRGFNGNGDVSNEKYHLIIDDLTTLRSDKSSGDAKPPVATSPRLLPPNIPADKRVDEEMKMLNRLTYAAATGDMLAVVSLVVQNRDMRCHIMSAAAVAAACHHTEIVKYLLDHGASIHFGHNGIGYLRSLFLDHGVHYLQVLVDCGWNFDVRVLCTLLCTISCHTDLVIEYLSDLDQWISSNVELFPRGERSINDLEFLRHLVGMNTKESCCIIKIMVEKFVIAINQTFCFAEKYTLLHVAIMEQASLSVDCLLNIGADVNLSSLSGLSPLHVAVGLCDIETVQKLLKCGADPNAPVLANHGYRRLDKMNLGDEVLLFEIYVIEQLFNDYGPYPLMVAACGNEDGSTQLLEILLDAGSDVHSYCPLTGDTALHRACSVDGSWNSCLALIIHEANPLVVNELGQNCHDVAYWHLNEEAVVGIFNLCSL